MQMQHGTHFFLPLRRNRLLYAISFDQRFLSSRRQDFLAAFMSPHPVSTWEDSYVWMTKNNLKLPGKIAVDQSDWSTSMVPGIFRFLTTRSLRVETATFLLKINGMNGTPRSELNPSFFRFWTADGIVSRANGDCIFLLYLGLGR